MRYTNKFVEFLNGANTIVIAGVQDYRTLHRLCSSIGLDLIGGDYWGLLHLANVNHCAINNSKIIVEYQPYKGFSIGYASYEKSEGWYGQAPWTMDDIRNSIR